MQLGLDFKNMHYWQLRTSVPITSKKPQGMWIFNKTHQFSHAFSLSIGVATIITICFTAIYFMLKENYQFFLNQAIVSSNSLLVHLEREQRWATLFLIITGLSVVALNFFLSIRIISRFNDPAIKIHNHLMLLNKGNWFIEPLNEDSSSEFKSLINEYNYLYKTLQAITLSEIQLLEKIPIDPNNREAIAILNQLIYDKKARVGFEEIIVQNVAALASVQSKRRVS